MKILTIAPHAPQAPPAPSGAASWLLSLLAALRSEHSVGVLAAVGCDTAALEAAGAAAVFTLRTLAPARSGRSEAAAPFAAAVVDLCRAQEVELVHLAGTAAAGLAPALADAGLPTALTLLGGDLKDGAEGEDLRAALARADRLLAVRPAVAARAADLGVASARVVLPGVDLDLFRPGDRAAARQALELPAGRPVLVGIGALRLDKGWLDAVAALRGLLDRDPFLILAGEGPDAERIAARARFLGLGARLALPGAVDAATLLRLYQAADVVLLPARDEAAACCGGCGIALLEAMACGAPVVTTPAFSDLGLVEDGVTGLLVPAGDPAALAQAIERLLADPERAAALGAAARRRVEEGFGLANLAGNFMAAIRSQPAVPLAAERPRRPSLPRPQARIAVFMPTWRCRAWLPRAIESVLAQTWPQVDLYVADDASGDVDAELEERFPTVTFLTLRERGGPFLISNLLLAITGSELVAFQDADDRSRPDRLAVQVDFLLDREYDACGSWCRHVDVWGDPVGFGTVPEHASLALRNRLVNLFFHPTALYRREALDHLGGFDVEASFSGDTELSFRACFSLELGNVQRFLYERTFLPDSLTQSAETGLGTPPRRAYLDAVRSAADAVRRGEAPPPAPGRTLTGRTIERPDPSCIARLRPGRGNRTLLREARP
jgi:glycosyltransferase involved in cell wall biosynthesis